MWIMTANGWMYNAPCFNTKVEDVPKPPVAHSLQGWKEKGYRSFIGWIHNSMDMEDPTQDF